ncbi:hypothetical protein GCM10022235_00890 [Kribbella ginsengisoli]|uniref:ApeA N-terminal domain-containing protein n=1 Tax=Kribbella ginsengisoli TaxID=363865 RepID=A0ABP6VP73_9ACTN
MQAVPDGHPAMLHDTGSQIELSFMFEYGTELERMVTGRMVVWGDDPEYRNHDYELPEVAWFADARGSFCLVDPRGWRTIGGLGREGRIRFRTAVLTGHRGITYAKINAVRSRVEGLERWMAITSVHHERLRNRDDGATDLITLKRHEPVVFSRQLNAALVPSYVFKESGVPGQKLINDEIHVLTKATTARDWNDDLDLHRSIRELLVVAGWERCGIKDIEVRRDSDPERAIAGNVLAPRWAPVTTYALDRPKGAAHQDRFLFSYDDIGATGVRRWARLRGTYRRGRPALSVSGTGVALRLRIGRIRRRRLRRMARPSCRSAVGRRPRGRRNRLADLGPAVHARLRPQAG